MEAKDKERGVSMFGTKLKLEDLISKEEFVSGSVLLVEVAYLMRNFRWDELDPIIRIDAIQRIKRLQLNTELEAAILQTLELKKPNTAHTGP